jgi:hypothetical protein
MLGTKRWTVDIFIGEHSGNTYAEARLHTGDDTHLVGTGNAKLNPADEDIPEIGDELAAARALSDLGHQLLLTAAADIEAAVNEPAHVTW